MLLLLDFSSQKWKYRTNILHVLYDDDTEIIWLIGIVSLDYIGQSVYHFRKHSPDVVYVCVRDVRWRYFPTG